MYLKVINDRIHPIGSSARIIDVAQVTGIEFTVMGMPEFNEIIDDLIAHIGAGQSTVIDLRNVVMMDSSAVGALVRAGYKLLNKVETKGIFFQIWVTKGSIPAMILIQQLCLKETLHVNVHE